DTTKGTPEQQQAATREFAVYKQRLRPLIRSADLYHVSERPDGVRWDGIEYFDPSSGRGAVFAFRGTTEESEHAFVLKGLEQGATYSLSFEDGSSAPVIQSGGELMR